MHDELPLNSSGLDPHGTGMVSERQLRLKMQGLTLSVLFPIRTGAVRQQKQLCPFLRK